MWLEIFFSPHLNYFFPKSLQEICLKNGFESASKTISLKTITINTLWSGINAGQFKGSGINS
jgi:hypothetical protein